MRLTVKILLCLLLFIMLPSGLYAEKKDTKAKTEKVNVRKALSTAKANIKAGSNLESTEKSMRELLKDSANLTNEKIWLTLFEVVKKQYDQLNEKLYLKQQSDTAKFFSNTLHMFNTLEGLDSIDSTPDKNGKVNHIYRKKHASFLDQYRANLYGGGSYFIKKQSYADAYNYFDAYLDCARQPLFADYNYAEKDDRLSEAAYWAVYCGYKLSKPEYVDKYFKEAAQDVAREVYLLQYISEAFQLKNDTLNYRKTLEDGFAKYPSNSYFFPHLAVYYQKTGMYAKALEISEKALALDDMNIAALTAESSAYFHMEKYDQCVAVSDKALAIDENIPIVYLNSGLSYYNQTIPYSEKKKLTKADKENLKALYERALPYLEKYRKMAPDDKDMWGRPLYNIYLNLNMGDQFEEMENLLEE